MEGTDLQVYYNYWCDGSCYHQAKNPENRTMGMGIYYLETNTVFPMPISRKLAVFGPPGDHNIAEYLAILCALTDLYIIEGAKRSCTPYVLESRHATFHSDSQLIIRQIIGEYQARKKAMLFFKDEVLAMVRLLNNLGTDVIFKWNPRDNKNQKVADWLSKVGNPYFGGIVPDETVAHQVKGPTDIEEMLLPEPFKNIRKKLKWS